MTITEILDESIIALFKSSITSRSLVLKGGSAMRLFENDNKRLSIDADFSLNHHIGNENRFFQQIKAALSRTFENKELLVVDFKTQRRPTKVKDGYPPSWGGWECKFKLVHKSFRRKSIEVQRRNALIPKGANSSVIELDISDGEYCGSKRSRIINGVKIHGYTRELLVLEKIRAICQQNPSYKFTSNKNRSRDFYDIQRLSQHIDDEFISRCKQNIKKVFDAKEVPLDLLSAFWDQRFLSDQEMGFLEVVDTVSGKIETFDVYVEHVRHLIRLIFPDVVTIK